MRPKQSKAVTRKILADAGVLDHVALLGVRGYYLNQMGLEGKNDRGIYDDAIFLISPAVYLAFNANTDPSAYRTGIATLQPGIWRYKIGFHHWADTQRRYKALIQAEAVDVRRDNAKSESGWFGINIHKGGMTGTSSLGCQTIWPEQWVDFIKSVEFEMLDAGQRVIPYLLIEN